MESNIVILFSHGQKHNGGSRDVWLKKRAIAHNVRTVSRKKIQVHGKKLQNKAVPTMKYVRK